MNFIENLYNKITSYLIIDNKKNNNNDYIIFDLNLKNISRKKNFNLDKLDLIFDIENPITNRLILNFLSLKKIYNKYNFKINNLNDYIIFLQQNINDNKLNIMMKIYNKNEYIYVFINKKNINKINKNINLDNLFEKLDNENIFLIKNYEKFYLSYGNKISFKLNENENNSDFIKNLKLNKILKKNLNIEIIFWFSCLIL
jgi:hypothetical protein